MIFLSCGYNLLECFPMYGATGALSRNAVTQYTLDVAVVEGDQKFIHQAVLSVN